ncbi:hypothetical protein LOC67_24685 [Stieleria sp. JC731]|uniref:hypothetical protein n=1 Tax=Stieleria sp. JC731 TaxID=2894195 RepID=UPI001E4800A3|nr:hypothetical protein [Stieleria sp. JC731]MCC9603760.1 hypothetical protein [Stieleria sp. JC731]
MNARRRTPSVFQHVTFAGPLMSSWMTMLDYCRTDHPNTLNASGLAAVLSVLPSSRKTDAERGTSASVRSVDHNSCPTFDVTGARRFACGVGHAVIDVRDAAIQYNSTVSKRRQATEMAGNNREHRSMRVGRF